MRAASNLNSPLLGKKVTLTGERGSDCSLDRSQCTLIPAGAKGTVVTVREKDDLCSVKFSWWVLSPVTLFEKRTAWLEMRPDEL